MSYEFQVTFYLNLEVKSILKVIQIYLSKHNCGTEFYFKKVIKSEIGKVVLFPAFYTHTHRGQVCPENKNRYIITGYFSFYKPSEKEEDKRNV